MSWFVTGSNVYEVDEDAVAEFMAAAELVAERECKDRALRDAPSYIGLSHDDAKEWAFNNRTDGTPVLWIDGDDW